LVKKQGMLLYERLFYFKNGLHSFLLDLSEINVFVYVSKVFIVSGKGGSKVILLLIFKGKKVSISFLLSLFDLPLLDRSRFGNI